jgi:prevent-host-death family protein
VTKTVTLREANQAFARCVREVEAGEEYLITRNGRPVARLAPVATDRERPLSQAQEAALARTRARAAAGWPIAAAAAPLDRDALHGRR